MQPDIEAFLKWAGYQHVPSKSALFTPGNASTWPQVCAVQFWAVSQSMLSWHRRFAYRVPSHPSRDCKACHVGWTVRRSPLLTAMPLRKVANWHCKRESCAQLLGVLRWLVDYLHYREKVTAAPPAHAWENSANLAPSLSHCMCYYHYVITSKACHEGEDLP